jgi:hypothetical protein
MPVELPDKMTPVTKAEVIEAFWHAWAQYFGQYPPSRESVWILVAQWALETGWGKSMHNFNMGNAKSRPGDGFDYQYFACNEILSLSRAKAMVAASPQTARITTIRTDGTAIIWLYPKHPGCRFRAFTCLVDGVVDHLHLVANRYNKAWPYIIQGNPAEYSKALKRQGYYTADEALYTKGIVRCFESVAKEPFDYDNLPVLTNQEIGRIQNLVASTQQTLVRDVDMFSHATFDSSLDEDAKSE